jgi:hypothetical protein
MPISDLSPAVIRHSLAAFSAVSTARMLLGSRWKENSHEITESPSPRFFEPVANPISDRRNRFYWSSDLGRHPGAVATIPGGGIRAQSQ